MLTKVTCVKVTYIIMTCKGNGSNVNAESVSNSQYHTGTYTDLAVVIGCLAALMSPGCC